jgi:hypothetical protein
MSLTDEPLLTDRPRTGVVERRVAAVAALLLGVSLFMTVAVINVPHDPSDAELVRWWQQGSNRTAGVMSAMWAVGVAVSMAIVIGYVRRLPAFSRAPQWLAFTRSMAAAVTAMWLVTGAVRGSIGHLVDVMNEPLPGVDVLRMVTALNYMLLGVSGMTALGLCILGVSVMVLRTRALGAWIGYLGLGCSVIILGASVAQYGGFTTPLAIIWSFGLAVAMWRQPLSD